MSFKRLCVLQRCALDNVPHDLRQRASTVFHLTVNYAFTMLKWTACENLPADLDGADAAAATSHDARYVTMLFNDETHTYEQVLDSDVSVLHFGSRLRSLLCITAFQNCRNVLCDSVVIPIFGNSYDHIPLFTWTF